MISSAHRHLIAKRLRGLFAAAAVAIVCLNGVPAQALTMPTNPYNTVGGATPVIYCRNPMDMALGGTNTFQKIDLKSVGCISGTGSAYPNGGDGYYTNTGGGDPDTSVEKQIHLATRDIVDLTLRKEFGISSSDDTGCSNVPCTTFNLTGHSGIQIWMASDQKSFTWAAAPWLIAAMQAGTSKLTYITLKGANSFALYQIPTGVFAGRYSTEGILTNGTQNPTISHIRFWDSVTIATPEPAAVGLMGLGLLALGLRRRKR